MVGCVIAREGEILGRGVTQPPGEAHAEILALREAGAAARGADLYVTLEPCCHQGRTPPCTEAIITAGIKRVFVGLQDPNPLVDGGGVQALRAAGIEVKQGCEAEACALQLAPFFRFLEGRPWVIIKAAVSLDGRIATQSGDSKWITGEEARREVHALRAQVDAVLVASGTALADNPRLNVRLAEGEDPRPVLLDRLLRLPPDAALLRPGALIFHGPEVAPERISALEERGAELEALPLAPEGLALKPMLEALARRGVLSLLVEGGGHLHGSLLKEGLADEALFYVAPLWLGRGRPVLNLPSVPSVSAAWRIDQPEIKILGRDLRFRGQILYPARR